MLILAILLATAVLLPAWTVTVAVITFVPGVSPQ